MSDSRAWIERLYSFLTRDPEGDACAAITEAQCRAAPANFLLLLLARTASKVGDRLASPKTTLAWVLQAVGAPPIFAGLIVPVRESGALLPQVFLAAFVRRLAVRKWAWVAGAGIQGAAVAGCALVALQLNGAAAGLAILGLLVLFSLARGVSSISAKDILGRTMPKRRRGQLTGWAASASGVIAIIAGASLLWTREGGESLTVYALYLAGAALLWAFAAAVHGAVTEYPGNTDDDSAVWSDTWERLKLLGRDRAFRNFVLVRALAVGSGLSAPFIVTLAHDRLGGAAFWLGTFIVADGLAAMVASPFWGRLADASSRRVLRLAMAGTGLLLLLVVGTSLVELPPLAAELLFPVLFFLLGIAHSGVRLGRKTYLVDMAEGNQRTDYVAVSNTVIGVLLLAAGAVTGVLALVSVPLALLTFAMLALAGAFLGGRLPAVSG